MAYTVIRADSFDQIFFVIPHMHPPFSHVMLGGIVEYTVATGAIF
jgi:hypothetical protein